jgi:hypothetical protein
MNAFFRKLRWLTERSDKEAELREELQFHLEEEAEQRQADGLADDEAGWAARRELGNLTLVEENTRAVWGWMRLEQVARDAAYGLRQVRRNPGFSAIAIATLALGIGGITAMFSAFDTIIAGGDRQRNLCESPLPRTFGDWRAVPVRTAQRQGPLVHDRRRREGDS